MKEIKEEKDYERLREREIEREEKKTNQANKRHRKCTLDDKSARFRLFRMTMSIDEGVVVVVVDVRRS